MNNLSQTHSYNLTSLFSLGSKSIATGQEGYWSPATASLDWCEENYIVSSYLAEFWNAGTNLVFLLWPLLGIYSCAKTHAEPRFYLSYIALMLVGTGSFLFHGTLSHAAQLLDELPMLFSTCVFLYCHIQMFSRESSPKTILGLATVFTASTAAYLLLETPILFQTTFASLLVIQVGLAVNNIRLISRTRLHEAKILLGMIVLCVFTMLLAFFLWTTDQTHCGAIQEHRNAIGYPLRVGLELHAWWHLLTGYSGYVSVVGCHFARLMATGRTDVEVTVWGGVFPVLVPKAAVDEKKVN
ncbi:Alkaline ceramidase 3 [Thoreauomyces humboldtii]|nr:Alkaline ceramidase 3 [Thoreauomyces humboldtii]